RRSRPSKSCSWIISGCSESIPSRSVRCRCLTRSILEIFECEWDYPFNMSLSSNLKTLNVYYTVKSEAFTFHKPVISSIGVKLTFTVSELLKIYNRIRQ
ncbi:hypothetical protein V1522DRAFT_411382, partial [Lipomyces starkeyi]